MVMWVLLLYLIGLVFSQQECLIANTRTTSSDGTTIYDNPNDESCKWGYNWQRGKTNSYYPNYPESIYGAGPYSIENRIFLKLSQVKSVLAYHDIDLVVWDNYGKNMWDFSYDLFLTTAQPGTGVAVNQNITDEIMIWFGWNSGSNPTPVQANAVNDGYNIYDYTLFANGPFPAWRYHQFRIHGSPRIPPVVSVKPFFDYIQNKFSLADLWFGSMQIGSEMWDDTTGYVFYKNLTYSITSN